MRSKVAPAYARCVDDGAERPMNVLEVNDLAIRFGRTTIFRNLSFSVPEGAALAIVGPNGSGKTVLLRALIGAIPFEGALRWLPAFVWVTFLRSWTSPGTHQSPASISSEPELRSQERQARPLFRC